MVVRYLLLMSTQAAKFHVIKATMHNVFANNAQANKH